MCLIIDSKKRAMFFDTLSICPAQPHLSEAYAAQGKRGKVSYLIPTPITSAKSASPSHDVVQAVKASSNSVRSLRSRTAKRQNPGDIVGMWSTTCRGPV